MLVRSLALAAVASLGLVACSFDSPAPSDNTSSASTAGKNKKKGAEESADVAPASALDGTWDITVAGGDDHVGPSQMTIAGGRIQGQIASDDEGTVDPYTDCTIVKNEVVFDFTISGDSMNGTFTQKLQQTGTNCAGYNHVATIVATRAHDDANADGPTVAEGEWTIMAEGGSGFAVSVAGLAAKAWDRATKTGSPVVTTVVAGQDATTASMDSSLTFAARKR